VKTAVRSLIVMVGLLGAMATAQAEGFRVGVVDVRKVLTEGKSGLQYRATIEKMVKERQDKITKEDVKLRALREDLEKNSLVLSDAQKEQKRKEIDEKVKLLRQMSRDAEDEVKKRESEILGAASKVLRGILDEIAKQEKVAIVVDKAQSGFLWAQEDVDLTEKVMKAYEAKAPK
jgi:outer membrane protein